MKHTSALILLVNNVCPQGAYIPPITQAYLWSLNQLGMGGMPLVSKHNDLSNEYQIMLNNNYTTVMIIIQTNRQNNEDGFYKAYAVYGIVYAVYLFSD